MLEKEGVVSMFYIEITCLVSFYYAPKAFLQYSLVGYICSYVNPSNALGLVSNYYYALQLSQGYPSTSLLNSKVPSLLYVIILSVLFRASLYLISEP